MVSIALETPLQDDVRDLVAQLNTFAFSLTPADFCHHLTVEQMDDPKFSLFVVRDEGAAIGMGGVRFTDDGLGEIKRMFVKPDTRGKAVGQVILDAIEKLALSRGTKRLVLETGSNFEAAKKLYERAGFTRCAPFHDYEATEWNIFFDKQLAEMAVAS